MNDANVNHGLAAEVEPMCSWAHINHCRAGLSIFAKDDALRRRTTAPVMSIRTLLAAVKIKDTGKRLSAEMSASMNPDIDHRRDGAPDSDMTVIIDGFVVGHGRPKAR